MRDSLMVCWYCYLHVHLRFNTLLMTTLIRKFEEDSHFLKAMQIFDKVRTFLHIRFHQAHIRHMDKMGVDNIGLRVNTHVLLILSETYQHLIGF